MRIGVSDLILVRLHWKKDEPSERGLCVLKGTESFPPAARGSNRDYT